MRALRQLRYASHYAERYQKREHFVGDVPEKSFRANCAERTLGLRLLSAPPSIRRMPTKAHADSRPVRAMMLPPASNALGMRLHSPRDEGGDTDHIVDVAVLSHEPEGWVAFAYRFHTGAPASLRSCFPSWLALPLRLFRASGRPRHGVPPFAHTARRGGSRCKSRTTAFRSPARRSFCTSGHS